MSLPGPRLEGYPGSWGTLLRAGSASCSTYRDDLEARGPARRPRRLGLPCVARPPLSGLRQVRSPGPTPAPSQVRPPVRVTCILFLGTQEAEGTDQHPVCARGSPGEGLFAGEQVGQLPGDS